MRHGVGVTNEADRSARGVTVRKPAKNTLEQHAVLRKYSIRSQVLPLKPKGGNRCTIPAHDELPWLDWHPNSLGHCSRYATPHILGCPVPLAACSREPVSQKAT